MLISSSTLFKKACTDFHSGGGIKTAQKTPECQAWRSNMYLELLDFHGQLHTEDCPQDPHVYKAILSQLQPALLCSLRHQVLGFHWLHCCLASCSLVGLANWGHTREAMRMEEWAETVHPHLLIDSVSTTSARFLHPCRDTSNNSPSELLTYKHPYLFTVFPRT